MGRRGRQRLTFSARIGLDEFSGGARGIKLGGKPGQLGKNLVDQPDLGGELILVDVEGQKAANVPQPSYDKDRGFLGHGW